MAQRGSEHAETVDIAGAPADAVVDDFGSDVIIPAAPIVLSNDDGSIGPIRTFADRIDDGGDPGGTTAVAGSGVIGRLAVGNDPTDLGELAIRDVLQYLCLRDDA